MSNITRILSLGFLFLLLLGGCSEQTLPVQTPPGQSTGDEHPGSGGASSARIDEQPRRDTAGEKEAGEAEEPHVKAMVEKVIKLYYADEQALELIEVEKTISWPKDTEPYRAAFAALVHSDDAKMQPLWEDQQLNDIRFADGTLVIDLKTGDTNLGSSAERLKILSLLQTMFQFAEVQQVQLLVDGAKAETLDGHMDIMQPFTREMMTDL